MSSDESSGGRHSAGFATRRLNWALPRLPPSPSGSRGKALPPGIQPIGENPQLHGHHTGRLATGQPVVDGFTLKGLVKLLTSLNDVLVIGFNHLIVYPIYRPSNRSNLEFVRIKAIFNTLKAPKS